MSGRLIGGRYEIVRKIAEGGMGAVYEAQHNLSKKTVALKILFPHIGKDEGARQRFLREVSAPAQIGHDGIVEVLDAGFDTQDGSLFVAMEMLRGETMRDRFARGGLTRDQVLDFFEELLDPLAAAHAKGIVHRDLKPENIYLHRLRDGREVVKLLDFGIARDLDAKSQSVTQTGIAMGTPHYMAPEQAMSARGVSCPADVWAVGAMLYEALAGRTPFAGETASAIVVHAVSQPHEPLAQAAPSTPSMIAQLVDRCLAKDAEKRPRDASALLAELRAARGKSASVAISGPVDARAAYGTPAPAQLATPSFTGAAASGALGTPSQASYGGSSPSAFGGAWEGANATARTPPNATPPPTVSSIASRPSGGAGRFVVVIGAVLAIGAAGVVVIAALGALALRGGDAVVATSAATVRVTTTIPGQLFVDGELQGPTSFAGQELALSPGTHLLEVRLAGATLASQQVQVVQGQLAQIELVRGVLAGTGGGATTTAAGGSVHTGELAPGDRTLNTGELTDYYEFSWTAGHRVHLELTSSAFDAYLILRYPSGRQSDNDDANGRNAMIDEPLDETGVYRVMVTSFSPGETGPYTLTVR